jgi:MGT family glycosyltransferase
MPRILFATWAGVGHLAPFVGVAKQLADEGCELAWTFVPPVGEIEVARRIMARRCPNIPVLGSDEVYARTQLVLTRDKPMRTAPAHAAQQIWDHGVFVRWVPTVAKWVEDAIERFRPDLIATEGLIYGASVAAHRKSTPWVALSTQLTMIAPPDLGCPPRAAAEQLADARAEMFAREGMHATFRMLECVSPLLNTAYTTAEFAIGADTPANTHLVGPSIFEGDAPHFPWARLRDDRPIIYLAAGSSQLRWPLFVYIYLNELAEELGVQLVVSGAAELERAPFSHVLCVPFAPQIDLLARVDAFVTHGGANSVMEAAYCGVPLLVIPMTNDQPIQAFFVARSELGQAFAPSDCTKPRLRAALVELLDKRGRHRARAKLIRDSYRSRNGAREAAQRVMAALH